MNFKERYQTLRLLGYGRIYSTYLAFVNQAYKEG